MERAPTRTRVASSLTLTAALSEAKAPHAAALPSVNSAAPRLRPGEPINTRTDKRGNKRGRNITADDFPSDKPGRQAQLYQVMRLGARQNSSGGPRAPDRRWARHMAAGERNC